jgi:predicted metalloprotease with PDZ domain
VTLTVFRRERLMNFDLTAEIKPFDYYTITELKDAGDAQKTIRESWLSKEKDNQKQ